MEELRLKTKTAKQFKSLESYTALSVLDWCLVLHAQCVALGEEKGPFGACDGCHFNAVVCIGYLGVLSANGVICGSPGQRPGFMVCQFVQALKGRHKMGSARLSSGHARHVSPLEIYKN